MDRSPDPVVALSDVDVQVNRLHHPVTALGPGRRVAIWFQGCGIGCRGCASVDTWDPADGRSTTVGAVLSWLDAVDDGRLDGVTITGGEPFDQPEALAALLDGIDVRRRTRDRPLDVLCFSGRPLRHLERRHPVLLRRLDAVVAGPYVRTRPTRRIWIGSGNQQLVTFTRFGAERYAPFIDLDVDRPPVQVSVDRSVWLIGIPRPGDLDRLEERLSAAGVCLTDASWRA
jgi:anaerobic ribonucleoside-triphosphate reductase activating protein